ncbi:serine-type D-Ala-D-Ala carboxypeptidase [Subdoligranulum variabile DSM 15176]|uniref:serine-type D-Ala-D-Ala carboxypeptidase n=2 Tax=Subdoligranulum variabile TaxID=214851 RepID=D1PLR0_9FIRM|nr:serine-type D-Ala-D-Ala carboxypeptidase [Subdoligranulum variabile DSM 15176]
MLMKRFWALFCTVVLAFVLVLPVAAEGESSALSADAPELTAPAGYVVNLDTNIVVYDKNSDTQLQAASLTKMMTCLLMLEQYQDQLDTITVTAPSYIYDLIWEKTTNASTADIRKGETQTLRNLLYAMLLPSANEAAYIVADYMGGGSIDNFVAMMNNEAAAIGCTGTTFADPCGLDERNVTTAKDAYLILRALTAYDIVGTVMGTASYDMGTNDRYTTPGTYIIQNTNKMISNTSYYRAYTKGGKTGSLGEWQNFAGWHSQDGENYISVLLNVPNATDEEGGRPALLETGTLMDWVYATYTIAPALDTTQPITESRIVYSTQTDTVMLYPADDMMTLLPREGGAALTEQVFNLPDHLTAPLKQGDVVGTVTLTIEGESIGTVDLIAGSDVERNQMLYTISRVGEFFSSTYFKVVIMLTMAVIAVYAFVWVLSILGVWSRESEDK